MNTKVIIWSSGTSLSTIVRMVVKCAPELFVFQICSYYGSGRCPRTENSSQYLFLCVFNRAKTFIQVWKNLNDDRFFYLWMNYPFNTYWTGYSTCA